LGFETLYLVYGDSVRRFKGNAQLRRRNPETSSGKPSLNVESRMHIPGSLQAWKANQLELSQRAAHGHIRNSKLFADELKNACGRMLLTISVRIFFNPFESPVILSSCRWEEDLLCAIAVSHLVFIVCLKHFQEVNKYEGAL
jgi:hypothetical protein